MYSIKGIYDGVSFKPKQPISIKGQYEVVITFVEPIEDTINEGEIQKRPVSELSVVDELLGVIPDDSYTVEQSRQERRLACESNG